MSASCGLHHVLPASLFSRLDFIPEMNMKKHFGGCTKGEMQ